MKSKVLGLLLLAAFFIYGEEYLVKYKTNGLRKISKETELTGYFKVNADSSDLANDPNVKCFQKNVQYKINLWPNDKYIITQYGWLQNLNMVDGLWPYVNSTALVRVGVVDTGIDWQHQDLSTNCLRMYGSDTLFYDAYKLNGFDLHFHGTHCAGIIGAIGNNSKGISGVMWKVPLVPIRVLDAQGSGMTSDIIAGLEYGYRHGIKLFNCSWGSDRNDVALEWWIMNHPDVLMVCAAGNSSLNMDQQQQYPAAYPFENVISVGAIVGINTPASYSNYGKMTVDLFAPGTDIISTVPNHNGAKNLTRDEGMSELDKPYYAFCSGTSMATPFVTGACAAILAKNPTMLPFQVKRYLLDKCTKKQSTLKDMCVSEGTLDFTNFNTSSITEIVEKKEETSQTKVWPTVVNPSFNVKTTVNGSTKVTVFDVKGCEVFRDEICGSGEITKSYVLNKASGIYFVKINKFIKRIVLIK